MKYRVLTNTDKTRFGADIAVTVDYTDLAALANGNTGSINIIPNETGAVNGATTPVTTNQLSAGYKVQLRNAILTTAFTFSDAGIVSNAVVVGDAGSNNRYLASTELSTNGGATAPTYILGTQTSYNFAAAGYVIAAFTGTSAKNLNTATAGSITFFFAVEDWTQINTP